MTILLVFLGLACGSIVGRRLYGLWSMCFKRQPGTGNAKSGYTKLPGR